MIAVRVGVVSLSEAAFLTEIDMNFSLIDK